MLEIWEEHGPPTFVTLAAAHLDPKKRKRKKSKQKVSPDTTTTSSGEKDQGTMADLAAMFGLGGKKKKAMI